MTAPFACEPLPEIASTVTGLANAEPFASGPSVAGSLSPATANNFRVAPDVILYPNETAILATNSGTNDAGTPSTIVALSDGDVMTLVGVATAGPVLFAL